MFGPKFVTLVFTDTSIRIAKASPSSRGVKISYVAKKNLPPSTVFNGRIINENLFRESLKALYLESYDQIKTKNLVLGLNEQDSFTTSLTFSKKPKDLQKNIGQYLINKLPFDLSKATILYKETSTGTFQIIAVRTDSLRLLSSVFSDVGFKLKAIVPIPLLFPEIVSKQDFPYLVISSGEDLSYFLVVKNTVVFSSTIKLKSKLNESDKEVIKLAKEIIEEEYLEENKKPLKNVYIFGSNANILKGFFSPAGFNAQIIATVSDSSKQASYDISQFGRCIALSFYTNSILAFAPTSNNKKSLGSLTPQKSGSTPKYLFLLFLVLIVLGLIYFFRTNLEDMFIPKKSEPTPPSVENTISEPPKEAAPSGQKEATPSANTKKEEPQISKKDVKIRILNGSGKSGTASEAKNFLESKGYVIVSVGNAGNFDYQKTQVRIKKSKQAISDPLTKDLKQRYAINVGSNLSENESYDVLLIIGGD